MHLAMVLSTSEQEAVSNALRLATFALSTGDSVTLFLLGAAVEIETMRQPEFGVTEKARAVLDAGGDILVCGTCLERRHLGPCDLYQVSDLKALYDLVRTADKTLTF